ncbi:MAG: hypothetical protein ABW160_18915 [Candidatus Thiodiazotropha sp. 4PDIV1]
MKNPTTKKKLDNKMQFNTYEHEALEKELALFEQENGLLADIVPVRGLSAILETKPELRELILTESKHTSVSTTLSSLMTQNPKFYKTELHRYLGESLINNLGKDERNKLYPFVKEHPYFPSHLTHQTMHGRLRIWLDKFWSRG